VGWREAIFGKRDAVPAPQRMVGFPTDGGLVGAGVTATTALGLSAVWRCLDILSNGVSQLEWREERGNLELPPSRLVNRPMGFGTRREWTSYIVSVLALYDISYLLKVGGTDAEGVPIGLLPLDPDQVSPDTTVPSISPLLPSPTYNIGVRRGVPADNLVIVRRSPMPGVSEYSAGVIKMARITFAAAIAAEGYASRYWQAGGSTQTVLESDQQIPQTTKDHLSDAFRERKGRGPDYTPILDGGLKVHELGADPTASAATEARREQVADIGRYFGIPTAILNAPAGDTETYNTTEAQGLHLVTYTLRNYIQAIEDAITDQLPGGRRMRMETEPLTRSTQLSHAQALQLAVGGPWMTQQEARDAWRLPPREDPIIPLAGQQPATLAKAGFEDG
jgi:HK97 family phage portal protein